MPLKKLVIARLLTTVKKALENQVVFESDNSWSDSTIVLSWLKNYRSYKQFVSHRTKVILKLTSPKIWSHCPTECNLADVGSRGQSAKDLKVDQLWWKGQNGLRVQVKITQHKHQKAS